MKRYFCETEDYNFVAYVDEDGEAAVICDTTFKSGIPTLEAAKSEDYSGLDGCETADEVAHQTAGIEVFDWDVLMSETGNWTEF